MCLLTSTSLCLDKIPALEYNNIVSGNVGMADEQDSGSCERYAREGSSPFFRIVYKFLIDCLAVVAELAYALD